MIEEAMTLAPIIFVLVILLFGFDSAGQVQDPPENTITAYNKSISLLSRISRAHRIQRKR
jgi:hypothetical protein